MSLVADLLTNHDSRRGLSEIPVTLFLQILVRLVTIFLIVDYYDGMIA
jgi:hypothetical protein